MGTILRFARALFALVPVGGSLGYAPVAVRGGTSPRPATARRTEADLRQSLVAARQHILVLEAQVQTLARDAQAASSAKDDFLANLSHELRTPLNATLGWIQLLRLHADEPVIRNHAIDVLERNARAQVQVMSDLIDLSRIVTGRMHLFLEDVDLCDIVRRGAGSLAATASAKNVTLQVNIEPVETPVRGDRARLEQVVWNIVSNALKFTPSGGLVTVSLKRQGAAAMIVVNDTGVGITADKLAHVFERLRQGDSSPTRSFGGLGLGLAIVHHLVHAHGGSVHAESAGVGRGTTFTVRVPVPPPDNSAPDTLHA